MTECGCHPEAEGNVVILRPKAEGSRFFGPTSLGLRMTTRSDIHFCVPECSISKLRKLFSGLLVFYAIIRYIYGNYEKDI